jgi:hypothetical protein
MTTVVCTAAVPMAVSTCEVPVPLLVMPRATSSPMAFGASGLAARGGGGEVSSARAWRLWLQHQGRTGRGRAQARGAAGAAAHPPARPAA